LKFSPSRRSPAEGYWLHVSRTAMACRFEITLPMRDQSGLAVAHRTLDEGGRLEQQLTVFRESSEISFLNRNAAARPVQVEPSLFELLILCQELYRETEGAFDITSSPLSRSWGFLQRQGRIPSPGEIEEARTITGCEKLWLDRESRTLRFERPGVEINLGSIGKGYAIDRMATLMSGQVRSALLSAGSSSMRAIGGGDRAHHGWVVGLRHPRHKDRRLAVLRLRDTALATSGNEEQFFERDGQRYGHIIDPRTGEPARLVSGVTVIARSAARCDALATAFYVGGPELAERYCSAHSDVLVVMLECGAEQPLLFGRTDNCTVEIVDE
jgi:thiamine biosynthesis lipoprotein